MLVGMAEMNGGITGLGKGLSASCFFGLGNNLMICVLSDSFEIKNLIEM